ncbi:MAG: RHS repeat-associated core domain-containing protein, partial [Bdellovibrionales bacterium]|nr:RHS repeat-associated core domain-containing protein [Bdellovibrionales bacterium]
STTGTTDNRHRYGGKYGYYTEGVTGIILAGARAYHPYIMRWLQRDPILLDGGDNFYEYVMGNPERFVDPTGEEPKSTLGGDDPGFENPEEAIRDLEEQLKDPNLTQREREKIRRRIKELRRRRSRSQQHHCDDTSDLIKPEIPWYYWLPLLPLAPFTPFAS